MTNVSVSKIILVSLFAVAMGFLESAVVVYLREIYYPEGFSFPLKIMEGPVLYTELFRELATLAMLVTVAMLVAQRWVIRFAWFLYLFAIWDLCYYLFLWLLIDWPESLLTWDILFLIPITWVGPVLAPMINSVTMILLAFIIIRAGERLEKIRFAALEEGCLIMGTLITIMAYVLDYSRYMLVRFNFPEIFSYSSNTEVGEYAALYIPREFDWRLFLFGEFLFMVAIYWFWKRNYLKS